MEIIQTLSFTAGIDFAALALIGALFALCRFLRAPAEWLGLAALLLKCAALFALAFMLWFLGRIDAAPTLYFFGLTGGIGLLSLLSCADIVSSCRTRDVRIFRILGGLGLAALLGLCISAAAAWLSGLIIAGVAFIFFAEFALPLLLALLLLFLA